MVIFVKTAINFAKRLPMLCVHLKLFRFYKSSAAIKFFEYINIEYIGLRQNLNLEKKVR